MTNDTPNQPQPLTEQEREELVEGAIECPIGQAIQGVYLQSLSLKHWFKDVDPGEILEARSEAPDGGMETSQRALDEMSPEERSELLNSATERFRAGCWEAVFQLERLALGLWEDPHKIDAELVATVAGLPLVARGERVFRKQDG